MNDACVGHELVDTAELGDAGLHHGDHLLFLADVDLLSDGAAADLLGSRVGGSTVDVRAHHVAAFVCESHGDRQADPGAGARHNCGLTREVCVRHESPCRYLCATTLLILQPPTPR